MKPTKQQSTKTKDQCAALLGFYEARGARHRLKTIRVTKQQSRNPKEQAFTLLEVVIAMTLMALLTLAMNQAMKRGTDFKRKIQRNVDQRATIDSAMKLIERDINLAFHYHDVTTEVMREVEKKKREQSKAPSQPPRDGRSGATSPSQIGGGANAGGNTNTNTNPNAPVYPNFKVREAPNYTAFIGSSDSLHFTNLNNFTDQPGTMNGDQQEVGYYVESCKKIDDSSYSGKCLWRRTSSIVDEEPTEGGSANVLLYGVKKFELRYFGKQKEDWVINWKSDGKEDASLKGYFPQAVEVTLVIEDNKRELTAIRVIPLRFPNNKENKNTNQQLQGSAGGGGR